MTPQQAIVEETNAQWAMACKEIIERCVAPDMYAAARAMLEVAERAARRAPAPTEPAVDRGLEAAAALVERKAAAYDAECGNTDPSTGTREYPGDGASWMMEMEELAEEIRALATPASPAVPAPVPLAPKLPCRRFIHVTGFLDADYVEFLEGATNGGGVCNGLPRESLHYTRSEAESNVASGVWREVAAPQVPQASQPTSAPDVMAGYIPKPPPPRPQRPAGAPWTDAEREEYRKNMKRGERCPDCSVIEGGQHFPGCSKGKP